VWQVARGCAGNQPHLSVVQFKYYSLSASISPDAKQKGLVPFLTSYPQGNNNCQLAPQDSTYQKVPCRDTAKSLSSNFKAHTPVLVTPCSLLQPNFPTEKKVIPSCCINDMHQEQRGWKLSTSNFRFGIKFH